MTLFPDLCSLFEFQRFVFCIQDLRTLTILNMDIVEPPIPLSSRSSEFWLYGKGLVYVEKVISVFHILNFVCMSIAWYLNAQLQAGTAVFPFFVAGSSRWQRVGGTLRCSNCSDTPNRVNQLCDLSSYARATPFLPSSHLEETSCDRVVALAEGCEPQSMSFPSQHSGAASLRTGETSGGQAMAINAMFDPNATSSNVPVSNPYVMQNMFRTGQIEQKMCLLQRHKASQTLS